MITDFPDFESANRLADLPAGRYVIVESLYSRAAAPRCRVILSELVADGAGRATAADLQVVLQDGTVLFRDFSVTADGAWRDSYGAKADALADLLPPDLVRFELLRRQGIVVEHDGKGTLSLVASPEVNHGP
jgi:hypothetical protein